jgi:hypothetical protein
MGEAEMLTFRQTVTKDVTINVRAAVVSWLANANGEPIAAGQAYDPETCFIKTKMFVSDSADDEAFGWYDGLRDFGKGPQPLFLSVQDETGESMI